MLTLQCFSNPLQDSVQQGTSKASLSIRLEPLGGGQRRWDFKGLKPRRNFQRRREAAASEVVPVATFGGLNLQAEAPGLCLACHSLLHPWPALPQARARIPEKPQATPEPWTGKRRVLKVQRFAGGSSKTENANQVRSTNGRGIKPMSNHQAICYFSLAIGSHAA